MLRSTVREPDPFRTCRFEVEAASEPECPYCGNPVAEEGDHCSALCAELDEFDAASDFNCERH